MQTKVYSLIILFSLLFISVASSQSLIWTTSDGLTYMEISGRNVTQASDFAPHSVIGKNTVYYMDEGTYICGINTEGGQENQTTGVVSADKKGTIFELNSRGLKQLHQFRTGTDDPANTTLFMDEHDQIYYVGPYYTSTGNKQYQIGKAGSTTSARILQYAYDPNELLSSFSYVTYPGVYGTSKTGGNNNAGFLYKLNSARTGIEIKYHFKKETGSYPVGKLVRGIDDYLYGVTKTGGLYNYGVIFRVHPNGTNYKVLHHFNKTDGAYPDRGLAVDVNGFFYGVTSKGGAYNKGVIFYAYYAYFEDPENYGAVAFYNFNTEGAPDASYKIEQPLQFANDYLMVSRSSSGIYTIGTGGTPAFRMISTTPVEALTIHSALYPDLTLAYPADGATNVPVNATFRPDTLDGALNYALQLSTNEYFEGIAQTVHSDGPYFNVQGLIPGKKYYARYKTSFWPDYGHSSSFTTKITTTDGQSVVTTPANGAVNVEAPTLKVTVKAVSGATRYTVQLSTASTFATVKSVTSTVDDQRTLTFTNLSYNTTYYARVKTNINSTYGIVTTFKTKAQVFSKVIAPVGSGGSEFAVLKIDALPIPQAKRYTLEINTNSSFTGNKIVYTSLSDGQGSFVIRDLDPSTTYYTRVRTDVNTTWGPVISFSTRESGSLRRLWGLTAGSESRGGTIFSFSVDSLKFTKHQQMPAGDGFGMNLVMGPDGLYGTANNNPYDAGYGHSLFRYDPLTDGYWESAQMSNSEDARTMMASDGQLYTAADAWTTAGKLVRTSRDFSSSKDFYFFKEPTGREPLSKLIEVDGWFYGTTHVGGTTGWGTVYRVRPDGSNYSVLHNFNFNDGFFPRGLAYGNDGWIYGTTTDGPYTSSDEGYADGYTGIVFRIKPDGSIYEVLHMFSNDGPFYPEGNIMVKDGVIYGVTSYNDQISGGNIFRLDTDGTDFVVMHTFNSDDGYEPNGDLVMGRDGFLYGTTGYGGLYNKGTIFRIRKDAAVFQKLFDFDNTTGHYPLSGIVLTDEATAISSAARMQTEMVHVYPNPSVGSFKVTKLSTTAAKTYLELRDFNGTMVQTSMIEDELELGNTLPKGIYLLKVISGDKVTVHRLVKK